MSGIYIPGMEMPKNCFDCPLFDDVYTDADGDDDYSCGLGVPLDYYQASGETNKGCPLVPVPPHGRLIEETSAFEHVVEYAGGYVSLYLIKQGLQVTPTIIPASKEGE